MSQNAPEWTGHGVGLPKTAWPGAKAMLHSVYDQPDTEAVHTAYDKMSCSTR